MLSGLDQHFNPNDVREKYANSRKRLIVLEYDGVLVPYENHPDLTVPPVSLRSLLTKVAGDSRNTLMMVSGRDQQHLDKYWSDMLAILVAENGAYYRVPNGLWQSLFNSSNAWINRVENALNSLTFEYNGSFVERKKHSVVWHHRCAEPKITDAEMQGVLSAIRSLNHAGHFEVRSNEFSLELATNGIDPGSFLARWIGSQQFDFIMGIGTAQLDDFVFPLLTKHAISVRVGRFTQTRAKFHLAAQTDVESFLRELAETEALREQMVIRKHGKQVKYSDDGF